MNDKVSPDEVDEKEVPKKVKRSFLRRHWKGLVGGTVMGVVAFKAGVWYARNPDAIKKISGSTNRLLRIAGLRLVQKNEGYAKASEAVFFLPKAEGSVVDDLSQWAEEVTEAVKDSKLD